MRLRWVEVEEGDLLTEPCVTVRDRTGYFATYFKLQYLAPSGNSPSGLAWTDVEAPLNTEDET